MSSKRDYIAEILEVRARMHKRADRWQQFSKRNTAIIDAFYFLKDRGNKKEKTELLKYISIGSVACTEAYFRMAIRDLINAGSPFSDRARKLQEIKFDLNTILSMNQEKVSPGEIIAHLLPLNGLEDINRCISTLTEKDFLAELKKINLSGLAETTTDELMPDLYEQLKDMFFRRHIFCHEVAMKIVPNIVKERDILGASLVFVFATDVFLSAVLANKS